MPLKRFLKGHGHSNRSGGFVIVFCRSALIILVLAALPARGQQFQLRHYGVVDGLAHGAVISIYQDRYLIHVLIRFA